MRGSTSARRGVIAVLVSGALCATALITAGPAGAAGSVRGFDGSTITLGSMGIKSLLSGAEPGVEARVKRFNDTNEVKGITLDFTGQVEDNRDPATSLSEARRLVTQVGVFALVGNTSTSDPGDYYTQQQVPYFGGGFSPSFCSTKPDPSLWGFSTYGCTSPPDPPYTTDREAGVYKYATQQLGKQHPTAALIHGNNESAKNSLVLGETQMSGAGFKVVYAKATVPDQVSDYTPYVQDILTSDDGHAPDVVRCYIATQCIPIWDQIKAGGFKGVFEHDLYTDALLKALVGTVTQTPTYNFTDDTPGMRQMKADVAAVAPNQKIDTGVSVGYLSTDMFIQALKTAAKKGKSNITPANVQKAAAHQTWKVKGVAGPVIYPGSTVAPRPVCTTLVANPDGTSWQTVTPYECTMKTLKIEE
jgi:ABC-type branched-subunit amino acid transport system substrate-binding protein